MSLSFIEDYEKQDDRNNEQTYQTNLMESNMIYTQGLNPEQLKMWKLFYHLELENTGERERSIHETKHLKQSKPTQNTLKSSERKMKFKHLQQI